MPSNSVVVIAAAGSGKTTELVRRALSSDKAILLTTFTNRNAGEVRRKFYEMNGAIPSNVTIQPWFTFLLREGVRPYQRSVSADHRITGFCFSPGRSTRYVKKDDKRRYYFDPDGAIYSDKLSEFLLESNARTGGRVLARLTDLYQEIYVDEVQDLSGYDLDVLHSLIESGLTLRMVGDVRQATYSTNVSAKHQKYRGSGIIEFLRKLESRGLCRIEYSTTSHRCCQAICDLASMLYPDLPRLESLVQEECRHQGIFLLKKSDVPEYCEQLRPVVLRSMRTTDCLGFQGINFGESKGLTFDHVVVFPTLQIRKLLKSGCSSHLPERSRAGLYVAVTRARQSVAIVYDEPARIANARVWVSEGRIEEDRSEAEARRSARDSA